MMKIWKAKLRRGFALFLALVMCISLLQLTALAAEETGETGEAFAGEPAPVADHEHNSEGWICKPYCAIPEHTHTDKCYASAESAEPEAPAENEENEEEIAGTPVALPEDFPVEDGTSTERDDEGHEYGPPEYIGPSLEGNEDEDSEEGGGITALPEGPEEDSEPAPQPSEGGEPVTPSEEDGEPVTPSEESSEPKTNPGDDEPESQTGDGNEAEPQTGDGSDDEPAPQVEIPDPPTPLTAGTVLICGLEEHYHTDDCAETEGGGWNCKPDTNITINVPADPYAIGRLDLLQGVTATPARCGNWEVQIAVVSVTAESEDGQEHEVEPEDGQWLNVEDGFVYTVEYAAFVNAAMTLSEDSQPQDVPEGILATQSRELEALSFDEKCVAHIGATGYETFSAAMTAAKDGETVTLLKDVNSEGMYMASSKASLVSVATQIANNITVDLNGHTITATGNATKYGTGYGVFRAKDAGYSLTIANSNTEAVGVIKGRVVNSTASTLNLDGPGALDIQGESTNRTIGSYGDININAPINKLTVTLNLGTVTVGENGSVNTLTVNAVEAKAGESLYSTLIVDGPVGTLTVKQITPNYARGGAFNVNTLKINAPVDTLALTQSVSGSQSKEGSGNKAYINASIGTLTAVQTGKASELYLDSEIETLSLTQGKPVSQGAQIENDFPLTAAGSGFHVGTLNAVISQSRVNLSNTGPDRPKYSNPTIAVPDVVLIEGMNGHEITAGQMDASTWKPNYNADPLKYEGIDYKYLTTVAVYNGKISLHKTVLGGELAGSVYLDGVNGDDANDGKTPTTAFKTFQAAKAAVGEGNLANIIVVNTVTVSEQDAWNLGVTIQDELTGEAQVYGILKRFEQFTGAMVNVASGGDLTLSGIILDGEERSSIAPLVTVQSNGKLTIGSDATLRNNANSGSVRGGAINNKGELILKNGALIADNTTVESGGGVYNTGMFTMEGGEITRNRSTKSNRVQANLAVQASGGGVYVGTNGTMEMSGGRITDNKTLEPLAFGGGIALGGVDATTNMKLVMTGGTIEGNVSRGSGGGIAVWTGGTAEISGGEIINNTAFKGNEHPYLNINYFAGAGIYVNKGATVNLKTVVVTENDCQYFDGPLGCGLAACPTSDIRVYVKNGGVFYGNEHKGRSSDIFVTGTFGTASGKVPVSITPYTLNGYKYNWYNGNGTVDLEYLNRVLRPAESINLVSGLTPEQGAEAAAFCGLRIAGNEAEQGIGGGIGCNGVLIIGEASDTMLLEKRVEGAAADAKADGKFDFTLSFTTGDGNPYSGSFTMWQDGAESRVNLDADGKLALTLDAGGYVLFEDLPVGVDYQITEGANNADMVVINRTTVTDLGNLDSYKNPTVQKEDVQPGPSVEGEIVNGLDEVVFTNVYDSIGLTIRKIVDSKNEADLQKEFDFEIKLLKQNGELYYATNATEGEDDMIGLPVSIPYTITGGEAPVEGTFAFNGSVEQFALADGRSITIKNLPVGVTALITELDEGREGYWTTVDLDGDATISNSIGVQTNEDHVVTFTNTPNDPDTLPIPFTKSISGNPETVPAFRFTLTEDAQNNKAGYELPASNTVTLENVTSAASVTGSFSIKFVRAGEYQFTVAEDVSNVPENWTYDAAKWTVTVKVTEVEKENVNAENGNTTYSNGLKAEIIKVVKDGVEQEKNTLIQFTNTYAPPPPPPEQVNLSVQKVWNDGTPADEHNSVMVGLYNSTGLQEYVMLSASNDWRYDWTGLEADETWRVGEVSVPGYTSIQTRDGDLVTITNTPDNDNPPPPPPGGGGNRPGNPPPVVTELPDPNVPGAPEEVTVIDEDVPLTYVKTWDPEEEEYVYVPEEEVPLADVTPETGDNRATALWAALALTSAAGLTVLNLTKPRKKEEQN